MSWKVGLIVGSIITLLAVVTITLVVLWYQGVFTNEGNFVCYDGLGCFNKTEPFTDLPLPWSPEKVGIEFRLYTPEGAGESNVISTENIPLQWRNEKNTVFLVHGFNSYPTKWYNAELRDAFLEFETGYQIITVDWEGGAKFTIPTLQKYENAVSNSRVVGALIAQLLESISGSKDYPMSKVHCIGHSLGAHACGYAGKILRGDMMLGRITGLDAAGPTFSDFPEGFRLNPDDATFVDAVHTHMSAGLTDWLLDGGYGIDIPVGHVDFVANGDGLQPGCSTKKKRSLIRLACSHERAVEYLTTSIGTPCMFKGAPCPNMSAAKEGECKPCRPDEKNCQQLGLEAANFPGRGIFLFETTKEPPFC